MPKSWRWPCITGASDAQGPGLAVTRADNTAGQLTDSGIATYIWDAAGRVSQITQQLFGPASNGATAANTFSVNSTIGYDANGRIMNVTHTPSGLPAGIRAQDTIGPLSASYTWDANGNRQSARYEGFGGSGNIQSLSRVFNLSARQKEAVHRRHHLLSALQLRSADQQITHQECYQLCSGLDLAQLNERPQHINAHCPKCQPSRTPLAWYWQRDAPPAQAATAGSSQRPCEAGSGAPNMGTPAHAPALSVAPGDAEGGRDPAAAFGERAASRVAMQLRIAHTPEQHPVA